MKEIGKHFRSVMCVDVGLLAVLSFVVAVVSSTKKQYTRILPIVFFLYSLTVSIVFCGTGLSVLFVVLNLATLYRSFLVAYTRSDVHCLDEMLQYLQFCLFRQGDRLLAW
jgi:formate hydrogenlyase subunit 3/multisubunit Na+/H+ antiporter MnhD subunit